MPLLTRRVLRLLLLPVVVLAAFILYGQCVELAGIVMPMPDAPPLRLPVLISQGFLAATLSAAVMSLPLGGLYGRAAPAIAALTTLPELYLAVPVLLEDTLRTTTMVLHALELCCYVFLQIGASWLAARRIGARRPSGSA